MSIQKEQSCVTALFLRILNGERCDTNVAVLSLCMFTWFVRVFSACRSRFGPLSLYRVIIFDHMYLYLCHGEVVISKCSFTT